MEENSISPNWIAIVALCSFFIVGPFYVVFGLTWPALEAQMLGKALPHDNTWTGILLADTLCLFITSYLCSSLLAQAQMTFTEEGIRKPGLTGPTFIRWAEVSSVKRHLHAIDIITPHSRLQIRPMVFKDRQKLLALLRERVPKGTFQISASEARIWD